MNTLEEKLQQLNPGLLSSFHSTLKEVEGFLKTYNLNFPTYTDHSADHTMRVFDIASELLTPNEIDNLNGDEIYILSMACLLHDIGMCVPPEKIKEIEHTEDFIEYRKSNPLLSTEDYIRDIHHELSCKFIIHEWEILKIKNERYAKAIGLVAQGHRKVDLGDSEIYGSDIGLGT